VWNLLATLLFSHRCAHCFLVKSYIVPQGYVAGHAIHQCFPHICSSTLRLNASIVRTHFKSPLILYNSSTSGPSIRTHDILILDWVMPIHLMRRECIYRSTIFQVLLLLPEEVDVLLIMCQLHISLLDLLRKCLNS
jgi:hypothetical protein